MKNALIALAIAIALLSAPLAATADPVTDNSVQSSVDVEFGPAVVVSRGWRAVSCYARVPVAPTDLVCTRTLAPPAFAARGPPNLVRPRETERSTKLLKTFAALPRGQLRRS